MNTWMGAAFVLGLAGSVHCAGMCSPLMFALPIERRRWTAAAAYQGGRIAVYTLLGLFFGLVGKSMSIGIFQQGVAIAGGVMLVVGALFPIAIERKAVNLPFVKQLTDWIRKKIGILLRCRSMWATFGVGALNGLLPCGLVYAALAGAISTAEGVQGAAFMAAFGFGTAPLLFFLMGSRSVLSIAWRRRLRHLQPIVLAIVGLWLIWRGLHADFSLFESAVPKARLECH
ncbi:MAG: sulfite exporter TauE/SafE family protein [Saprospiraceae bacterium]|nr:sulfite exporter TauE/SafE family protein [Saprospiraceae bacterium]MDW8483467.1 sulfite exporter TauE/SafE family protein [Saprospiraceae bacterium]